MASHRMLAGFVCEKCGDPDAALVGSMEIAPRLCRRCLDNQMFALEKGRTLPEELKDRLKALETFLNKALKEG